MAGRPQRRAQYLRNARAVGLDTGRIAQYVDFALLPAIFRELKKMPPDEPLGYIETFVRLRYATAEASGAGHVVAEICVGSRVDKGSTSKPVIGGGFWPDPAHRENRIGVFLNGLAPPSAFLSEEGLSILDNWTDTHLAYGLYSTLIHELTHSADFAFPQKRPDYVMPDGEINFDKYANHPLEVRAFMQQIVDESVELATYKSIRKRAAIQPNKNEFLVLLCLHEGDTWPRMSPDMSQKTQNRIMLSVTNALADEGLLFP